MIHNIPIKILLCCLLFERNFLEDLCGLFMRVQLWEDLWYQACVVSNCLLDQMHNNYTMSSLWVGVGWSWLLPNVILLPILQFWKDGRRPSMEYDLLSNSCRYNSAEPHNYFENLEGRSLFGSNYMCYSVYSYTYYSVSLIWYIFYFRRIFIIFYHCALSSVLSHVSPNVLFIKLIKLNMTQGDDNGGLWWSSNKN